MVFTAATGEYLVNMAHIARYDSDSIFLSSGEKVYLTRKKHNEFVKAYMWYLQNGGGGVLCMKR